MSRWHYYDHYFKPSRPRTPKGGIKAQSKQGSFGESWWAKRWIEVLESFNIGARLGRGRSYARRGQVTAIDLGKGIVKAKVQGSRPKPYEVIIKVATLSKETWRKLAHTFCKETLFSAKLLAGEMPKNIEDVFKAAGLSLFPQKSKDLQTECSCPDWSNPCKHIAAVYYLLGEEFDRDPFLIFTLRGMSREELVELMGNRAVANEKKKQGKVPCEPERDAPPSAEPLATNPRVFWGEGDAYDEYSGEVLVPPVAAILPKRLGKFPFWRGEENFLNTMERIYTMASPQGIAIFLSEHDRERNGK